MSNVLLGFSVPKGSSGSYIRSTIQQVYTRGHARATGSTVSVNTALLEAGALELF